MSPWSYPRGGPACAASALFVTLALTAAVGAGPTQAPPKPAAPTPPPAQAPTPASQKPTFAVEVNLVTTDVIARDGNGQFVADLDKKEFEVYEDGVLQEIASLVLVHGGRVFNRQLPPPPPTPGRHHPAAVARRPTTRRAASSCCLSTTCTSTSATPARIRELFKKISTTLIHDGDMFGIVSTGPSSLAIDLTYDKKRLDEAIKKISGNGLKPSDIIQGPEGAEGPSEVRYRAHVAFSTAYDILQNLEKVQNRRKAIVYVSNGYDFNPFAAGARSGRIRSSCHARIGPGRTQTDGLGQRSHPAGAAVRGRRPGAGAAELTRTANRANATVYTIDPRGLVGGPDLDEQVDPTSGTTTCGSRRTACA